jgi:myosin heavy subunit
VRVARELPANTQKFRRRIPLELTAQEIELLEREEPLFGSKRATLVAGLEALARLLGVEAELEQAVREREEAHAQAAQLEQHVEKAKKKLAESSGQTQAAAKQRKQAEKEADDAVREAQAQIDRLEEATRAEQSLRLAADTELAALEAERLEALHCPRCGKWAPRKEWATKEAGEFELVYHRPCGFHESDGLRARSVIGYRRL